jgi:hypothetical protein
MTPELMAEIASNNGPDVEAIIAKIGIATLLALVPNFMAIAKTVQAHQPTKTV